MKQIYFKALLITLFYAQGCIAMEEAPQQPEGAADFVLPVLPSDSVDHCGRDYVTHKESAVPSELRLAFFGSVVPLAHTHPTKRDPAILANAQAVYSAIEGQYPEATTRDRKFLFYLPLVLKTLAGKDTQPFRQYYSPVEELRQALKNNEGERGQYQVKLAELCQEENKLQAQMKELEAKLAITQTKKERQKAELTLILRSTQALGALQIGYGVALQEQRDALRQTVIDDIAKFVELKQKLAQATVAHEQTNLQDQLTPLDPKIKEGIKNLWHCVHYLKRMHAPDGKIGTGEELKWKFSQVNPKKLGITNYEKYLEHK